MTPSQVKGKEQLKTQKTKEAIALAMQSRWQEAEEVNRLILQDFPDDVETYNRLGKALMELHRYSEAQQAFQRALELSSYNVIAKKNLERLAHLQDNPTHPPVKRKVTPHLFIEESGKAGITYLKNLAPQSVLAKVAAGDPLTICPKGNRLLMKDADEEYLGEVEPKLALRLTRLINGGNRYEAQIVSVAGEEPAVMIRETYKHPSQSSMVSFPSRGGDDYKAYMRSSLLKYDLETFEDESDEPMKPPSPQWVGDDPDADAESEPEVSESAGFHEVTEQQAGAVDDPEDDL